MSTNNLLEFKQRLITFSQNREDIILWGYFYDQKKPGFYIDIGANEPIEDSVTKFFSLREWRGINIEPQKSVYKMLCKDRDGDINLNVGVSDKVGSDEITSYKNSGVSTFNNEVARQYDKKDIVSQETIPTITLNKVFSKYVKTKQVHFLKIDVEGYEEKVINSNNWSINRPWVLCVEQTWESSRWKKILKNNGYIEHINDGLNSYFVAKERSTLITNYRVFSNSESIRFNDAITIRRVHVVSRLANGFHRLLGNL